VRYTFGEHHERNRNYSPVVSVDEVKKVRAETANRGRFWTLEELEGK
jgi:hypothetical protein